MHVVAQPHDGLVGRPVALGGSQVGTPDSVRIDIGRGDNDREQRASLDTLAVRHQLDAVGRAGDVLDVVHHAVVEREPLAERIAQEGFRRLNLRERSRGEQQRRER